MREQEEPGITAGGLLCGPQEVPFPESAKTIRVVQEGQVDISVGYGGTLQMLVGRWVGMCLSSKVWTF